MSCDAIKGDDGAASLRSCRHRRSRATTATTVTGACPSACLQDLLAMVPRPVAAVLLLFPITESTEAARKQGAPCVDGVGCLLAGGAQPRGNATVAATLTPCSISACLQSSKRLRRGARRSAPLSST